MPGLSNPFGPVSSTLAEDLHSFVRRNGIVVWLDADDHYSGFVDRLIETREAGALKYEVRAFRGSFLALMRELEHVAGGPEKVPLVVHLPGFNEESVRQTPLLELYLAGSRYRKALDTLVDEAASTRVPAGQLAAFKEQGLTLDGADAWLAALLDAPEGGFAAQLRGMQSPAVLDDLLGHGFLAKTAKDPVHLDALWTQLSTWTGMPSSWPDTMLSRHTTADARGTQTVAAEDVAFATASWALCVEFVDDLKRLPILALLQGMRALPRPVIDACRGLAEHLRDRHPDFYQRTADETEALIQEEIDAASAADLGKIDTFRFEEDKVLKAAIALIAEGTWDTATEWAALRADAKDGSGTFWLRRDPARRSAWLLVKDAARLGLAIAKAGNRLPDKAGLDGAIERYTAQGTAVDQAHRQLEQRRVALLYPQLPEFEALRACLDAMRTVWRAWADAWARDFSALCRSEGFVPSASLQQRTLFDEVVRPMTLDSGTTALFLIDAFRYEMGDELYRALADTPATTVHIKARLAELPTVTAVGMNALAPVASGGRLTVVTQSGGGIAGFSTGEMRVTDPESRKRAMHDRVGGRSCPLLTLEEVVCRDQASLKGAVAQARLVVVHCQEIDNAGEKGVGPAVFDHVMQKLRAAWRLLRDAGVRRFVFTADHGFLLLDDGVRAVQGHGRKVDPKRRHVISPVAADHDGEVRVPLADLGYAGIEGHLMFPETTAVFDTGRRAMSFVHGGNSLQERVIPVVTVVHRAAAGASTLRFGMVAEEREGVGGMHCLAVTVQVIAQQGLHFGSPREVELGMRVREVPGVQVELCQTRGKARLVGGTVHASVGEGFELFFRLTGRSDARVLVELYHPMASLDLDPCVPDARFAVTALRAPTQPPPPPAPGEPPPAPTATATAWLQQIPEGGMRQIFEHLAAHGSITEAEATKMMGSARAYRKFANAIDDLKKKAPFDVRTEVLGAIKRHVREGSGS